MSVMSIISINLFLSLLLGADIFINAFVAHDFVSKKSRRISAHKSKSYLSVATTEVPVGNDVWWKEGLKFGCTACGRCCQNEGEVWVDSDEFADLSTHLNETPEMTLEKYSEKTMSGWVKLKNQVSDDPKVNDRCIFLGADGKQCSIYEARPIQCRTYPFWPRLLSDPKEWSKEAVQPDTVAIEEGGIERHWTPEGGGCEGFTNPEASIINTRTIHRNHELYKMYTDMFPFLSSGDDENRLLAKTSVIQGVTKATTAWVEDFVLKYTLCPFAEHVFVTGGIRYRVFLGTDKKKIMEKVKYEMLALLTSKEEDVATTLLMLPFAFQDFQDFYDFSLDLEDIYLPALEKDTQGPGQVIVPKRKSLLQKKLAAKNSKMIDDIMDGGVDDKYRASGDSGDMGSVSFGGSGTLAGGKGMGGNVRTTGCPVVHTSNSESSSDDSINYSSNSISNNSDNDSENSNGADINTISSSQPFREEDQDSLPEIQLAFFHPSFMWADTDFNEALNYEKRAPFPTINLLRAARIREYTNEAKYKKIANANVMSLEAAGSETLSEEFEIFFKLAVEGAKD